MRWIIREGEDRQEIDPGDRVRGFICRTGLEHGSKLLSKPQQAEIIYIHLQLRGFNATTRRNGKGAMAIARVDQDIDFAADLAGKLADGIAIGDVEGNDHRFRQFAQCFKARRHLPGLGLADPDVLRTGLPQRPHDRLPERGLAVGHEDFARTRIARHLAQLRIFRQVRPPVFRTGDQHRLARPIECRINAHAARRGTGARVHKSNDVDAGIEADDADAPRQPFAEEQFLGIAQHSFGKQFAAAILQPPDQTVREAGAAYFPRRILHRAAVMTNLKLQPTARRSSG